MNFEQKKVLRSALFRHLDGIVISPTAYSLKKHGVTDVLLQNQHVELNSLTSTFNANEGYLNVALRGLCSQGWLIQHLDNEHDTISYQINEASEIAFKHFYLYEEVTNYLKSTEQYHPRDFELESILHLESIYSPFRVHPKSI